MTLPSAQLMPYDAVLPYKRVEFPVYDGTILRGNLYHASNTQSRAPLVIFVHGLGLVKEQYLENWFKYCLQAGYHVLTYDHRSFGDSDGLPRNNFNWIGQTEDFIDVVTYARSLPEVIDDKVFAWGVAHAGGIISMAAALDKRLAGLIMFLPCIDGAWDKSRWGSADVFSSSVTRSSLWDAVQRNRFQGPSAATRNETVRFWPLTDKEAAGTGGSILSGDYVHQWSTVAQQMAEQGGNKAFTGELTLMSIWEDFATNPTVFFPMITTPLLWIMASDDVVCGPLDFTKEHYDNLKGPKELCVLEGEHLAQYFDPGFPKSVEAMLGFLQKYAV